MRKPISIFKYRVLCQRHQQSHLVFCEVITQPINNELVRPLYYLEKKLIQKVVPVVSQQFS